MVGALLMRPQPPSPKQVDRLAAVAKEDFNGVPELRDLWVELERLPHSASSLRALIHANERLRGARPELQPTAGELARLAISVAMVWGAHDPFGPVELGRAAAQMIPNAEFHVVDGGHAPWLDSPREIATLASRFLRAQSPIEWDNAGLPAGTDRPADSVNTKS